ncbi:MAG: 4'-phosphopantetheinyl transferase family protein [Pseudomonadota bacterium]
MIRAHISWCRECDDLAAAELAAQLAQDEQEELQRLRDPSRRRGFILSRLLLRRALAEHLHKPGRDLRFYRDNKGRLLLRDAPEGHFSLSHCRGFVAILVADAGCGIDVEVPRNVPALRLAERYFSPAEVAWLSSRGEAYRLREFFRLWTLKEAAVKALGQGLANNLARLAFSLAGPEPRLLGDMPALAVHQLDRGNCMLAGAVATAAEVDWQCREMTLADL